MKAQLLERGPVIRRRILLVLAVGIPLLFLRQLNDPINVPKFSLLVIGTAMVAAIRVAELLQGASPEHLKRLLVPAAAIVGPLLIAWAFSPYRAWSLFGLYGRFQGLIPYVVIALFGILVADAFAGNARPLAWALVITGAIVGAYGLIQVVEADPFGWALGGQPTTTATSTTGNPNFTGGFLGMMMPLAVGLWVLERKRRTTLWVLGGFIGAGWAVAYSQGGWAAGVAGVAVTGGFILRGRRSWAPRAGAAIAAVISLAVVGIVVLSLMGPNLDFIPVTTEARGRWWVAAVRMAGESPLFGKGPNSFAVEGVQHRTVEDAMDLSYNFADDPHSVPFALLAGAGILGLAGFGVVLAWALREARAIGDRDLLPAAFLGAVVAYFVQALVSIDEVSLRSTLWMLLGGFSASLVPVARATRRKTTKTAKRRVTPKREPLRAPAAVAVAALVALAATWWSFQFSLADGRVASARRNFAADPDAGQDQYELALGFRNDYAYRSLYGFDLANAAVTQPEQGAALMDKARRAYSYLEDFPDVLSIVGYARSLREWGRTEQPALEEAVTWYRRAVDLDPLNPDIRAEAADVLSEMQDYEAAAELLEPAADYVHPRYGNFWGALALARAHLGEEAAAREAIERAFAAVPNEPRAVQAEQILAAEG